MSVRCRVSLLLFLGALGFLAMTICGRGVRSDEVPRADENGHWFERGLVGMEIGPTGAESGSDPADVKYASKYDGREIVERCRAAHCDYVVIWARDGEYAYYDSKVMPKCPGLGTRDPLREAVEAARPHQLPVIAYCVLQAGGATLKNHPEFAMRDPAGNPIGRVCFNSSYLDFAKKLVAEQLAYGIDGFHLDMMDQGFGPPYGCWCQACANKFQAKYGRPMPKGVTWDEDWDRMLEFRYASSQEFEKTLEEHIHKLSPSASLDYNYHGNPPFSWEVGQRPVQHAIQGDFVTGETGMWGFGALGVSYFPEFYRAARPADRFQVAMSRGARTYHDQTTRPLVDIRWELLSLLSHGAFVTIVDKTSFDGTLDSVAYERIGAAFQEAKAKQPHFGQSPVAEIGLYYSSRTRDWVGREQPWRFQQSAFGAHRTVVEEHVPFGVVLDENTDDARQKAFPIIWLPSVAILSDSEISRFKKYVEQGGNLIVTGPTGTRGPRGEAIATAPALAELLGARAKEVREDFDHFVRFAAASDGPAKALAAGFRPDWPFLVHGPAIVYEASGAVPVGELIRPYRTLRQQRHEEGTERPVGANDPIGPAVLVNTIGKGRVVTFAVSPDMALGGEYALVEARRLVKNAVRLLQPDPIVKIDAPSYVESVVTKDAASGTLRVHLIGYTPAYPATPTRSRPLVFPGLVEDPPMFRVRITLKQPFHEAKVFGESTELTVSGQQLDVVVSDVHEVVIVAP